MKTSNNKKTKFAMIITIIALVVSLVPISNVFAEGLNDQNPPTNPNKQRKRTLPRVWKFQQNQYERLGKRLERTEQFITRLQERIDTANQNGKDTASIQAALDVFKDANGDALLIHQESEAIISTHAGFDVDGKVIDRVMAVESVESLADIIRETRDARRNPFRILRDALRSFREANRPSGTESTPAP